MELTGTIQRKSYLLWFSTKFKDHLSLKILGKDSDPIGITSIAEAYITIHESHHSLFTCAPWPKIGPIILNTSNMGMMGFVNNNVSFSARSDSIRTEIFSMNLQGKLVFDLWKRKLWQYNSYLFWISYQGLAFLSSLSCWQLIQTETTERNVHTLKSSMRHFLIFTIPSPFAALWIVK